MGNNYTRSKRRAEAMDQPLANYIGWNFIIVCPRCRDPKRVPVEALLHRYAGSNKVSSVVNRLRCSVISCRAAPSSVKLIGVMGRSGRPAQEVVLVGPGAF
jgi:hypothetical protein